MITLDGPPDVMPSDEPEHGLGALILEDQFASLRRSLSITAPVNQVLCIATLIIALREGNQTAAFLWLSVASAINAARFMQSQWIWDRFASWRWGSTAHNLRAAWMLAGLAGLTWASTPLLAGDMMSPSGVFHMIVGAGITAGSVALIVSYARVVMAFVTPILLVNAALLAARGTVESLMLGATIILYFVAVLRGAFQSQAAFCETSRLKHEAEALALSLKEAHRESSRIADEMSHRALHDPLTGLLNRAGFMMELKKRCSLPSAQCSLLMLDLDGFKSINDAFGHGIGDQVLIEVARRCVATLPEGHLIARLGGDEFAIACNLADTTLSPDELAKRLVEAAGTPFEFFDGGRLGASVGVYHGPVQDTADMLIFADEALYAAKAAGRNRHCVFDETLRRRLDMRRDSERDLLPALRSGALEVWFQPIFKDGGRTLGSIEGLVRWNHPKHGWIAPPDIVAAAAMAGQSERFFCFVLDAACLMIQRLQSLGMRDIVVAMNVSPREMAQLSVDRLILDRLSASSLPASSLEIEITEETAVDLQAVAGKLSALSNAGVRIAIDDFGAGYSSLATLHQLHADRLKIDRSLVTGLSTSAGNRLLLQAIVSLGRAMNLELVAEGVESADDFLALQTLGFQGMQGYHLGPPMRADAIIDLYVQPHHAQKTTPSVA